jgi:hypothetical protein
MLSRYGFAFLVALIGMPCHASVLLLGENPGQYGISVYIYNDSDLPYPESGLVGSGFLRYESEWLDAQLGHWRSWVDCYESGGDCDDLYSLIEASDFNLDTISFDMLELLIDASFDMYGVHFGLDHVVDWHETIGGSGPSFISLATVLNLRQPGGNELYFGAGDEEYTLQISLNGHYASHESGYCYAQDPSGAWTEDLCYDISVDPVPASSVPEPGTIALFGLLFAGMRLRGKTDRSAAYLTWPGLASLRRQRAPRRSRSRSSVGRTDIAREGRPAMPERGIVTLIGVLAAWAHILPPWPTSIQRQQHPAKPWRRRSRLRLARGSCTSAAAGARA